MESIPDGSDELRQADGVEGEGGMDDVIVIGVEPPVEAGLGGVYSEGLFLGPTLLFSFSEVLLLLLIISSSSLSLSR
jgi:hypothetical protein